MRGGWLYNKNGHIQEGHRDDKKLQVYKERQKKAAQLRLPLCNKNLAFRVCLLPA